MSVNTTLAGLSQTASSNGPDGSVDPPSTIDDSVRYALSFIAALRDGKGFTTPVVLASAGTADIGAQNAMGVEISGTTTITSFGTAYNGPRLLRFTGALTLTHNASTLILPGAANITTVAGDTCIAMPKTTAGTADGWVVFAFQRATASMIRLNTGNGYGSSSTAIRRFTNVVTSQGADITYADSSTLGGTFTINTAGTYAISYSDSFVGSSDMGISLNSSQLTTQINAITVADRLSHSLTAGANGIATAGGTFYLPAGSVIRAHCDGTNAGGTRAALFTITRVS